MEPIYHEAERYSLGARFRCLFGRHINTGSIVARYHITLRLMLSNLFPNAYPLRGYQPAPTPHSSTAPARKHQRRTHNTSTKAATRSTFVAKCPPRWIISRCIGVFSCLSSLRFSAGLGFTQEESHFLFSPDIAYNRKHYAPCLSIPLGTPL